MIDKLKTGAEGRNIMPEDINIEEIQSQKKKILIVDDQAVNIEFLKKMLMKWGYEVITANRGIQALKESQENKPDLILLDIIMPDLTGYEVCRGLKVRPETADIPVIFLTAKGEIFDRIEGLNIGAHDYVAKPFHPDELRARIQTALKYKEEKEELKKQTDQLKALSIIDELTNFYNRKYLEERIQEELARAQRYQYSLSLALISPDDFENLKRTYSNSKRDNIIKQLGELMKRNIRAVDIVTRYSEDSFAILLPQTDEEGARVFGEKIMKVIDRNLFYGIPEKAKITVSIGIAALGQENIKDPVNDMTTIMDEAENALLVSRERGSSLTIVEI
jgi:diguanylate cyclase (GGDEF)-like protein